MVVFLPREVEGLHGLEEAFTADALEAWTGRLSRTSVRVSLPRFTATFETQLNGVLRARGLSDAFDRQKADFSGIDGHPGWLYVGFLLHKAFVDVNEEGTEAAAVTGGGCFPAGTEVLTAAGPRAIETLEPGTVVWACDAGTGRWNSTRVLERLSTMYEGDVITIQAGSLTIRATGNHPFYVQRGDRVARRPWPGDVPREARAAMGQGRWVEARDLEPGDVLRTRTGDPLPVTALESRRQIVDVYNLAVERYSSYALCDVGVLVHNKGSVEPTPIPFQADHPFMFLIRHDPTGAVLFAGRVSDPTTR